MHPITPIVCILLLNAYFSFAIPCTNIVKKLECKKRNDCIWDFEINDCRLITSDDYSTSYNGAKLGIDDRLKFDNNARCFITNTNKLVNALVGPKASVPYCFKEFHRDALVPICGHPLSDIFRYCHKGLFYENKNHNDFVPANKILILMDGCLFCSPIKNYFITNQLIELSVEVEQATDKVKDLAITFDAQGNYLLAFQTEGPPADKVNNITLIFKHRCNRGRSLEFKVVSWNLHLADQYPTRIWEQLNTPIGLNGQEQFFNQLEGKADL